MEDIDILLPTQTFRLSRDFILQQMPGSLFANAIELDPHATELPINNPAITPSVMQFLVDYSHGIEPAGSLPELVQAEVYLNVPWMLYYSAPGYDLIVDKIDINAEVNLDGINQIINQDDVSTYKYLLSKGYDPPYSDLESAIYLNSPKIAALIMETKHFTPKPNRKSLVNLMYAHIRTLPDIPNIAPPGVINVVVRDDIDYLRSLLSVALELSEGRFEQAYSRVETLDTMDPDKMDRTLYACLYIMFNQPAENPEYYAHLWALARTIPWIPSLPEEPTSIFRQP